jgi:Peptidase inhibitor family I36
MTIRQRITRLAAASVVLAAVTSFAVLSPIGATSVQAQTGVPSVRSVASGGFTCSSDYWCDYIYDNGTGLCFKVSPFAGPGNIPNWASYGCRNVDGSIQNNSPFTLRIYYGPNYQDPHACIKPFTKISDLFNYDFNSGSGPHNLVIGNDIASSTISLTSCTNPL